jgi:hypothetical protein
MKSATEILFGKSDNCSKCFLSCPLDSRHPVTAVRCVELNPVRSCLVREAESQHWGVTASAEFVADGGGAGWCSSSSAVRGRPVQWRWVSWTVTLPPHSPGCDNAWAFGPAVVGRRRSLGQGSLEEPDVLIEAVRRESGTEAKRHRYSLTEAALRAHLPWAECGLAQKTSPGSRVLVAACRTETASV